jgi:MYXO-CTERM domain-containing protein
MTGDETKGLSRRTYVGALGTAAVAGTSAAKVERLVGTVTAQETGPSVDASDSRIGLSNDGLAVTVERSAFEDVSHETICSGIGTEPGENLTGTIFSMYKSPISGSKSPRPEMQELVGFGVAKRSDESVAYQTVARYDVFGDSRDDPHPIEVTYRVTLQKSDPFVLVDHRIKNVGETEIRLDQDSADIHDGMQAHSSVRIPSPSSRGDYGYYLSNGRSASFANVGQWNPQGSADWGTVYDADTAITVAYLSGRTDPKMWITAGNPTNRLDFLVGEVTLDVGEAASYRTAVAIQEATTNPAQQGSEVVSAITARSEETEQAFVDTDSLTVQRSDDEGLEQQEGARADEEENDIPVLHRFADSNESLWPALGVLGALGLGGYAVHRRRSTSDRDRRSAGRRQPQAPREEQESSPRRRSFESDETDGGSERRQDPDRNRRGDRVGGRTGDRRSQGDRGRDDGRRPGGSRERSDDPRRPRGNPDSATNNGRPQEHQKLSDERREPREELTSERGGQDERRPEDRGEE